MYISFILAFMGSNAIYKIKRPLVVEIGIMRLNDMVESGGMVRFGKGIT